MKIHKVALSAGVLLAASAGMVGMGAPAHAAGTTILALHTGDTFTTGQKGVLCEVHTGGVECMFNTARPYGVTSTQAKKICGNAALEDIQLSSRSWTWGCATDVQVIPTKASNAWATPHRLPIDSSLHAPVIPANWTFTVSGLPCHVSYNGAAGCAATGSSNTGFTADAHHVVPRGTHA
ncbi:hypothetical protein [Allobranchiibius sp. GilTou38]|uniref:hypothetical protein n=1 Tax=Allobranchiibius sp. GilTou38 TaxID=2815210 RepID=UPI001AA1132D|nr:hypothetical protein [Allobranchiibius sp. GilTou38]MBO1765419.1 hypothetical protein [Allobranchiibius sp. GilTou38]